MIRVQSVRNNHKIIGLKFVIPDGERTTIEDLLSAIRYQFPDRELSEIEIEPIHMNDEPSLILRASS